MEKSEFQSLSSWWEHMTGLSRADQQQEMSQILKEGDIRRHKQRLEALTKFWRN